MDRKLSFGIELEVADIDCTKEIPEEIGSWECGKKKNKVNGAYVGNEIDGVNSDGTGWDPSKVDCHFGGELHVVPSYDTETLVQRTMQVLKLFPEAHANLPSSTHIHVGIPDWTMDELRKIYEYTELNEADLVELTFPKEIMEKIYADPNLPQDMKRWVEVDRRSMINPRCYEKMKDPNTTLEELQATWGKRSMFYFPKAVIRRIDNPEVLGGTVHVRVNSLHIQHILTHSTIEFRTFATTIEEDEIRACVEFAEHYIREALKGKDGQPLREWADKYVARFPKWEWDDDLINIWWKTKKEFESTHRNANSSLPQKTFKAMEVK